MKQLPEEKNEFRNAWIEESKRCSSSIEALHPEAATLAAQLLQSALQSGDGGLVARAYILLYGIAVNIHADFLKGLEYARLAAQAVEGLPNSFEKAFAQFHLGEANEYLRHYSEAITLYSTALQTVQGLALETQEERKLQCDLLWSIGLIYKKIGLNNLSADYFRQMVELSGGYGLYDQQNIGYVSLAQAYMDNRDYEPAIAYFKQVLQNTENTTGITYIGRAVPLCDLATIYLEQKNYTEAETCALQALELYAQLENEYRLNDCYVLLCRLMHYTARPEQAAAYWQKATAVMQRYPAYYDEQRLNNIYSKVFAAQGDYKKAYEHMSALNYVNIDRRVLEDTLRTMFENERYKQESISRESEEIKKLNEQMRGYAQKLEVSNKDLQSFAHITSHDLREPLRMITSYARLLDARLQTRLEENEKALFHFVIDGSQRMEEMITRILDSAKGKSSNLKPVDLNRVMEQVRINLGRLLNERNALLQVGSMPVLLADETQMMQVFQNLVTNAVKYNVNPQPTVMIAAEKQNGAVTIRVADNGVGIPVEQRAAIFEMFSRVENESGADGTGIGLSTVKNIIEKMGGAITVMANEPQGSVFVIQFKQ